MQKWSNTLMGHKSFYSSFDQKVKVFSLSAGEIEDGPLIMKQILCDDEKALQDAQREAVIALSLDHPHLCPSRYFSTELRPGGGSYIYMIMPKLQRSLYEDYEIRRVGQPAEQYTEELLWEYLNDLVEAFCFLQEKGIAHRDVKLQNMLLDERGHVFVCDFGYTKRMDIDPKKLHTLLSKLVFLSPALRTVLSNGERDLMRVQHNVYKSDVYSLGVAMLLLTTLETPKCITSLQNLQSNITAELGTIKRYSPRWVEVLSRMMTVEETARPDFLELRKLIEHPVPYADDEIIERLVVENVPDPLNVTVKCGLSHIRVNAQESDDAPCRIALAANEQSSSTRLYSIDIVCVIDVSGSMVGDRMRLTQDALICLVEMMGDRDRVALVTFSDIADRKCGLIACSENGKAKLKQEIESFVNDDLTNISAGFTMALEVLKQRRITNAEVALMLFTDGKHNCEGNPLAVCEHALRENSIQKLIVHCFGFGEDLDSSLLMQLAEVGNGGYYHIESPDKISESFGLVFGSITSIVAKNITVSMHANEAEPSAIMKVYSKDGAPYFAVESMSAGTKKDMIFVVKPSLVSLERPISVKIVTVVVTYVDMEGLESTKTVDLYVTLRPWVGVKPTQDGSVWSHWCRVKGANCLKDACDLARQGRLREADERLSFGIEALESGGYEMHAVVAPVLSDIRRLRDCLRTGHSWEQEQSQFESISYCHLQQSASVHTALYATDEQKRVVEWMRSGDTRRLY